ncbi:MAG: hypothetical protein HY217_01580, partial [Candidatus Rokubacteria bacterium]|nr:hypothetical protein [Candidatus Rokubacteria bacterium]
MKSIRLPAASTGSAVAWTLYLLLPMPGWGILSGRPLGAAGATLLLLVWWSRLAVGRVPFGRLALALVALKLAAGPLLLDRGLVALYYA